MSLLLALWLDLAVALSGDPCALQRRLLHALDRYCATSAAVSEQRSCQIVRRRFAACDTNAVESDGGLSVSVEDKTRQCLALFFERRRNGELRLDSFRKLNEPCNVDCTP